jgi:hypothetical protein
VRALRMILAVPSALAAMVLFTAPAGAAPEATAYVRGIEYAATATEGKFGGAAKGDLQGGWLATVAHEPLAPGETAPITDGFFRLYSHRTITGTFVGGSVAALSTPETCLNERFDVTGTLKLSDGGNGAFRVVLTHLRALTKDGCRTYGATVAGTLTIPSDTGT